MNALSKMNKIRKNIVILSASQFISDIGTASYISFVNLWLIQIFKDSVLVGTIVSITEIAMFFLSPLITTFIKGKNIKTMLVASDYLRSWYCSFFFQDILIQLLLFRFLFYYRH